MVVEPPASEWFRLVVGFGEFGAAGFEPGELLSECAVKRLAARRAVSVVRLIHRLATLPRRRMKLQRGRPISV
jgi:hypothetical protein